MSNPYESPQEEIQDLIWLDQNSNRLKWGRIIFCYVVFGGLWAAQIHYASGWIWIGCFFIGSLSGILLSSTRMRAESQIRAGFWCSFLIGATGLVISRVWDLSRQGLLYMKLELYLYLLVLAGLSLFLAFIANTLTALFIAFANKILRLVLFSKDRYFPPQNPGK